MINSTETWLPKEGWVREGMQLDSQQQKCQSKKCWIEFLVGKVNGVNGHHTLEKF